MEELALWPHQSNALGISIDNDFASGTHAHATGTGKSILGHALVRAYCQRYPKNLMIWMCEQANVINEIFSRPNSRKGMLVCDLVTRKPADWWSQVQSALCWGKPILVIVNRAFIVSERRYEKLIKKHIGLIIHDECHSGIGSTTKAFYDWLRIAHANARVIGLSATPPTSEVAPHPALANILSRFSIYDATALGIIVPLKMCWCETEHVTPEEYAQFALDIAQNERIKKIIIWCGTIDNCYDTALLWKTIFQNWIVAVDTSQDRKDWLGYDDFVSTSENALLFCAAKHREGSDIAGLGMAVFVDGVEKRGNAVFVQCAGRVLRKPKNKSESKPYGIVLDLKAKDGMELCDRVGEFLQLPPSKMPWSFDSQLVKNVCIQSLTLTPNKINQNSFKELDSKEYTLSNLFVRPVPEQTEYTNRLNMELKMIQEKQLTIHLIRAIEVLRLAGSDVPHVTRGSCGSSLVCYLLGISNVDPVKHKICFARFLNDHRETLPDIDFDFPYNRRADIFLRMAIRWPGTIARISNHVHYHERSALREALRQHGYKGHIPVVEMDKYLSSLPPRAVKSIQQTARDIDGEFNCYSLHCGGVVYYPDGVVQEDLLERSRSRLLPQVVADKRDIADAGHFKIDILSSRALAQLVEGYGSNQFELDNPPFTPKMEQLFATGNNIGITLAESPLIRAEFRKIKPKSLADVAACLALIRPAARKSACDIVYDDDAIMIIAELLKCSEADADLFRRGLAKNKLETLSKLENKLGKKQTKQLQEKLGSLSLYGFCKAHAMSYAQLVCWLAWCKVERPITFWKGALNHCQTSYKRWVHFWEAWKVGVNPFDPSMARNEISIYASCRRRNFWNLSIHDQLRANGYWDVRRGFIPGCYIFTTVHNGKRVKKFRGVIASYRKLGKKQVAICFGTDTIYTEMVCPAYGLRASSRIIQGTECENGECNVEYC